MCRLSTACGAALVLLAAWTPARVSGQTNREQYLAEAHRTDIAPRIDGVLDEAAWRSAPVIDAFTQQEPRLGEPSSERTEVRLLYDARHLYIGVHAYDSNRAGILATEMRRDADRLLDEDSFQIVLDTFNDSRNGYMFVTSPLGAKLEQQITEDGDGRARGANANINRNWDGVWDSAARVTEDGWTAEIAIPVTTLRFRDIETQTWGINFMRTIRQKNEVAFWAPVPRAYGLASVSLAGTLNGLRSLNHGLDLKLKPFVVSGLRDRRPSAGARTTFLRDVGFDARYGVTSGLNLDVTYNTDFAQVEADEQQVNLTRFSLLFPEKREFFLENAGLFNMGTGNTFTSAPLRADLFFTRRIGLSDSGQPVPIVGGVRLTGKAGRQNIALLDIQTESAFGNPGENFLVGRYSRDILRRSRIGAIVVNKEATNGSRRFNRTVGADANLALGQSVQVNSYVAKTSTPGLVGKDRAAFGRIAYRTPAWNVWLNYLDVQDNFNAEVGFVQRRGVRATKAYFSRTPRPGWGHIRMLEPMAILVYVTDQTNRLITRSAHAEMGMYTDDGSYLFVLFQKNLDVLDVPFRLQPTVTVPVGAYSFKTWTLSYTSSPARRVYGRLVYTPQEFYGGTRKSVSSTLGFRATNALAAEAEYQRNDVKTPYGNFLTNLAVFRLDYSVSPRMTLRSLTQYNSLTREVTNSIRYNFIYRPGSDLYVVYNDMQQTGLPQGVVAPIDRQFVVKLSYLLAR
jgi:hypothetical protein